MKTPPPSITIPDAPEVAALTERLLAINTQIKALEEEKEGIEERLAAYAILQQHEPLKDEKREGRRVYLPGKSARLPVVFSSDLLIGSFKEGSPKHKELLGILTPEGGAATRELLEKQADTLLKKFFSPPDTWDRRTKDGKAFRAAVAEWLPADVAPKFITACVQRDKFGVAKTNTSFDYKAVVPFPAPTAEVVS